jgi:hypothetical protein
MKYREKVKLKLLAAGFVIMVGIMPTLAKANENEMSVLFGLGQPILFKGYNVEINYRTNNWVFEYSHGWNLKISDFKDGLTKEEKEQNLDIYTPYTTGGGVGYRFTEHFHAALEYKIHKFEVANLSNEQIDYTVQTLGVGLYYTWKPFKDSGFIVVPAIRYWPTIATSLKDDKHTFSNGNVHDAHGFDVAPNIKVGYAF